MSGLRVTGGRYRGRIVEVPRGPYDIRPAMDRMRESIFSVLGDLTGRSFLDLFSGSGIIGLEAASRGAAPVVCVERDRAKFPVLLRNVSIAEERIECHCLPVERSLLRLERAFSVIFCDPPFPYAHKAELIHVIAQREALEPGGLLLVHYPKGDMLPEISADVSRIDERIYGRSIVRIYRRSEASASAVEQAQDPQ